MLDFLIPLYFAAILACGAQGYDNTHGNWSALIILSAGFGGGIIRDSVLLRCTLAFLSLESIPDIYTAWIGAFLQARYGEKSTFKIFLSLVDSFGVATFVIIGASAAQRHGCEPFMVWISGMTTALGGGLLSSLLSGQRLRNILLSNVPYRSIVMAAALLYVFWLCTGTSLLEAQCTIVLLTGISNLMMSEWFQNALRRFIQKGGSLIVPVKHAMILIIPPPYLWRKGEYMHHRASKTHVSYHQPWHRPQYHLMQPT